MLNACNQLGGNPKIAESAKLYGPVMASAVSPACILLVYGIPGSGKTTLSRALLENCKGEEKGVSERKTSQTKGAEGGRSKWNLFAVHFDEFFPPDLREQEVTGVSLLVKFHKAEGIPLSCPVQLIQLLLFNLLSIFKQFSNQIKF